MKKSRYIPNICIGFAQICLLILSIFATGFLFSSMPLVRGDLNPPVSNIGPPIKSSGIISQTATQITEIYSGEFSATVAGKSYNFAGYQIVDSPQGALYQGITKEGSLVNLGTTEAGYNNVQAAIKEGIAFTPGNPLASTGVKANFGIWEPEINLFGSQAANFFTAHLFEGLVWGGVVALGIKFLGPMLGLDEDTADAAALAAFGKR